MSIVVFLVFLCLLFLSSLLRMLTDALSWTLFFKWIAFHLFVCTIYLQGNFNLILKYTYLLRGYVYNNFTIMKKSDYFGHKSYT